MSDTDELLEATTALILPLLHALDALNQAGRLMHPPALQEVVSAIAPYRDPLEEGRQVFTQVQWPEHLEAFTLHANMATTLALRAFDGFASAMDQAEPPMAAVGGRGGCRGGNGDGQPATARNGRGGRQLLKSPRGRRGGGRPAGPGLVWARQAVRAHAHGPAVRAQVLSLIHI